ncbi:MAG: hypothetical protein JJT76_15150 [Clostridiaceae bacterium]|nr:hypothetical protein [Clostridiaceae bacterium]
MKKRLMTTAATIGLVGLMVTPVFANEAVEAKNNFSWGQDQRTTIEMVAEKANVPLEVLLEEKLGSSCFEVFTDHGITLEDIEEMKLKERFATVEAAVEGGKITAEEAASIKEKLADYGFLLDGQGPHQGNRQGVKIARQLNLQRNTGGRGPRTAR